METSANGLNFIESNEGLVLTVKPDSGGKLVIGIGHDLLSGEFFLKGITVARAWAILQSDVDKWDLAITDLGWQLTQNQWNALSDFTHECGVEALEELAAHGVDQVCAQLPRWVHAKNAQGVEVVLPGMVARREKEITLWNTP